MATPRTRTLSCPTCKGRHPHRQLTVAEQARAKEQLGLRAVHEFWMCVNVLDADAGTLCRNLRRPFQQRPFPEPVKLLPE
ncbi:hypothetical protein ABZX82_20500 [Streptomyces griseoflavus]|uniref:hypothetical protein n=1 Tax=Streptomyces griseoflavus TaxID=35619 RepID=UPI0033A4B47B